MTNLFELKEGKVEVSAGIYLIPEFKALQKKCKNNIDPDRLSKIIAYIFFTSDYKSDYNGYGLDKDVVLIKDLFGDEGFDIDEVTKRCIDKYKELQNTSSMKLLNAVRAAVNSMEKYYDEMTIKSSDTEEQIESKLRKFDIKKITGSLKDLKGIFVEIKSMEKIIKDEETEEKVQIQGGGRIGMFENPEKAKQWL